MSCIESSLWVKICGLTQPGQAVEIAQSGANALGFICVQSSPRYVTPAQIHAMNAALKAHALTSVERVGVFANADQTTIAETVKTGQLTALQLHGQESPQFCGEIRQAFPELTLIKAFRIRQPSDLQTTLSYEAIADRLLLDAYHPHQLGGTGKALDWQTLKGFQPSKPWILAGGLTADNVQTALSTLSPDGIDLSSGVETSPGIKSMEKIRRLFESLKRGPALSHRF